MKLSICFYPNHSKVNKKTGKTPLYLRVTLNRQKAEMRLDVEIDGKEIKKWDEGMMRFSDRSMPANMVLSSMSKYISMYVKLSQ